MDTQNLKARGTYGRNEPDVLPVGSIIVAAAEDRMAKNARERSFMLVSDFRVRNTALLLMS